jgi:hypothetical protein
MKSIKLTIGLAVLMLAGISQAQTTDTNFISFTNVTVEAWTGYRYAGDSGDSTATLGAMAKLYDFNLGKLQQVTLGAGVDLDVATTKTTINDLSGRIYLVKDVGLTEFNAFVGAGYLFSEERIFTDFGAGVKYNLYQTKNWSAFIGTDITFRLRSKTLLEYLPGIQTGIAF